MAKTGLPHLSLFRSNRQKEKDTKFFSGPGKLLMLLLVLISGFSQAQILTFEFVGLAGNEATAASNLNDPHLSASAISRGAGLTASANAQRFNATNWALTSIANAVSGNKYMEFTITPDAAYQFSVSSIFINLQRSGTGNTAIALRSSVDGYASDLDGVKAIVDNTSTQSFTFTFAQANSTVPVTYRFYSYAEATGGTGGIGDGTGDDIVVTGTVTSASGCSAPSLQASALALNTPLVNGMNALWTAGDGDGSMLVLRPTSAFLNPPTPGTAYSADLDYSLAGQIDANNRVIFRAAGTSASISGLSPQTSYTGTIYEYNSAGDCYNLTSPSSANLMTFSEPPVTQSAGATATTFSATIIDLNVTAATFPSSGATNAGYVVVYSAGTPTFVATNGTAPAAGVGTIFTSTSTVLPSAPGTTFAINALASNTLYNFLVIPFTWDGVNPETYNYLTSGAPTASATTTGNTAPIISNLAITAFQNTTATFEAEVIGTGGDPIIDMGFVWAETSTNASPILGGTGCTTIPSTVASGVYSENITGLPASTPISLVAYATNGIATTYTTVSSFTTLAVADHLVYGVAVPTSGFTNTNLDLFTVEARRPDNSLDVEFSGNISVNQVSGSGILSGTSPVAAVAGVATFTDIQFDLVDTYTISASGSGLTDSPVSGNIVIALAQSELVTFEFVGLAGSEVTAPSNTNDPNLAAATISRGAGLTASGNTQRFNATNWALTSIANAVSGNNYMEFTITPNASYQFSVSSIDINFQRSSTGPSAIALRSSVDGYASDLDGEKAIVDNTSTQAFTFTFVQANSTSPVTYRFYCFAESATGTGGIGDGNGNDIVVKGLVTSAGPCTPVSGTDMISSCSPITWIDGNVYSASNNTATFTIVGGAANGCDSIVTLDFTLNSGSTGTDMISSCAPITWIDGNVYSASNNTATFTIVGGAANGCDSIVTLDFTIITVGTPINVSATNITSFSADVNWDALTLPSGGFFSVQYKELASSTWISAGTVPAGTFMTSLTGLLSGTTYEVQVAGNCDALNPGTWSISAVFTTNAASCNTPLSMTISGNTGNTVTTTWTAVPGAGWYEFRYKMSSSATWLFGGTLGGSATSKTFAGLMPSTSYDFEGRTFCPNGTVSAWSTSVSETTVGLSGCSLPPATVASAITGTSATISWTSISGAGYYEFRYKPSAASTWISGGTASATATSKNFVSLMAGTSYDFEGRTFCTNGIASAWGATTFTTTTLSGCELPPVLNATAVVTTSSIQISWPSVTGAAWYSFQYKMSSSSTWINGGTAGPAATSKTYSGLMAGTSYDFQARTHCSNGIASAWSGMETFITDGGVPAIATVTEKADNDMTDKALAQSAHLTTVYPNPTADKVNIEIFMDEASANTNIKLMDMSGRLVREVSISTEKGVNTLTLDLQELSNGMYTMFVYQNGQLLHTDKVKKN